MSKSTVITKSQFAETPPSPSETDSSSFLQRQQRRLKEKQQRNQDASNGHNHRSIRTIVQIIEIESAASAKPVSHQMIPYIDEDGESEEGVGNGRIAPSIDESSVSGGDEVDANSCDNNNQSLIKNSNLNNGNCNKTNSAQAVRHSSKISNSEQLKKQFMSVDVTEQQRRNDDAVANGLQNGTAGVVHSNGNPNHTKLNEQKRNTLNAKQSTAPTIVVGGSLEKPSPDLRTVANLTFPCKLEVHENVMTTTNGAIIIKSCLKRIDMNDSGKRTSSGMNNNKSVNKNSLNSTNDRTNDSGDEPKQQPHGENGTDVMIGVDQVDRAVVNYGEGDPYTELEIYLEKVKKEISDVFEQLEITEKIEDSNNDIINTQQANDEDDDDADDDEEETVVNAEATNDELQQHGRATSHTTTTSYIRSVSNDDNKLIKQDNNANGYGIKTKISNSNNNNNTSSRNKNCSNKRMNEVNDACKMQKTNINMERKGKPAITTAGDHVQQDQQHQQQWNVDSMKEFDDLVEQEIKSLITRTEEVHQQQLQQKSASDTSSLSSLSLSTSSSASISPSLLCGAGQGPASHQNIIKLEKHTSIPLQSFVHKSVGGGHQLMMPENGLVDRKPPIDMTKKAKTMFGHIRIDPVLKIEEDVEDAVLVKRETATQTSPILGKLRSINHTKGSVMTLWTSEESILRGADNVDEDNKSSSSSACDEVSAAMSSGKSGNSLDSTCEYDNPESGIGTATPPPDKDECWKKLSSLHSRRESLMSNVWTRRENASTQTSLTGIRPTKYLRNTSTNEDPDLLEVLSLYEGRSDEEDDDFDDADITGESIDTLDHSKLTDFSFHTDSSSSTKLSLGPDELGEVVLRRKPHEMQHAADSMRQAVSFPLNYLEKNNVHNSFSTASTYSLPMIKRHRRLQAAVKLKPLMVKERPYNLPLDQEMFQDETGDVMELPSPSSASLHNELGQVYREELGVKCSSAPILLKQNLKTGEYVEPNILRYSRSQSDRYLAEIEATEACKWLRAAGFPQYAQMYEDLQFPIDLSGVAKDHPFLENDPLQSLYRRLVALNRCATMRLDAQHKHGPVNNDDSDDETYALSENWTFQHQNRRWSRVSEMGPMTINLAASNHKALSPTSRESTPERMPSKTGITLNLPLAPTVVEPETNSKFRRTGSERLKDGAKAFLRRVESIKSRRRKRQNREGVVISGPQMLDLPHMNQKMTDMKCVDIYSRSNPSSPLLTSPGSNRHHFFNDFKNYQSSDGGTSPHLLSPSHFPKPNHHRYQKSHSNRTSPLHFYTNISKDSKSGDDSSSYCSEGSQESSSGGGGGTIKKTSTGSNKKPSRTRRFLQRTTKTAPDKGCLSDSECASVARKSKMTKESNGAATTDLQVPKIVRGGSLNLGKESKMYRDFFQNRSFRSRSAVRNDDSDRDDDSGLTLRSNRSAVVRWHSFQSPEKPNSVNIRIPTNVRNFARGTHLTTMSCGQLQIIRKLALVTLTGYMERYCPTHRSGFNWELSRFIKIMKTPDYKDKKVFGIPLVLSLQRTGHALPRSIQYALKWLRLNTMDQVGIFRKSGVKSRIAKLKTMIENGNDEKLSVFDAQQAYDVADMVKQYFRELPESLLTTKLSDTFIAIFHHIPEEVRADAVQAAILLLPDEHREVLFILLEFLSSVSENSMFNQMTANNLAVCLAPSLFHNGVNSTRSSSVSPRRKRPTGIPDAKELAETRASHDCLTYLIQNYRQIFTISSEKISKCNFGCMEESRPRPLESLGEELQSNWCGYLYECTKATMREVKEKSRGWTPITSFDSACEISYKKVGDGHPLRLWRCKTEVEAPPLEVLHHITKERHLWDTQMLQWRVIKSLDEKSELFQYSCAGINVTDYCVVRSWQTDLPRSACVIVETSVEHTDAPLLQGSVRGVVLASRYFIEPCGSGRSRVIHLARVDMKGRTPEWYNKNYGHICSHYLTRIRNFFKNNTEGPESKV